MYMSLLTGKQIAGLHIALFNSWGLLWAKLCPWNSYVEVQPQVPQDITTHEIKVLYLPSLDVILPALLGFLSDLT